jgi:hypothetical protein
VAGLSTPNPIELFWGVTGTIRSDYEKEFENTKFNDFYNKRGYRYKYSAPHTPQQNKVVERKKIEYCKNLPEPCFMSILFQNFCGLRRLTWHGT